MNSDRSQQLYGSMAESPEDCGGVVMVREKSMMKRSMHGLLRVALVAVMALLVVAGSVSQSEAVLAQYWITQDTGTTVATGVTTDFTTTECANDITTIGKTTLALKDLVGNCAGRWDVTTQGVLGAIYYNTAYVNDTIITGQATGNLWYVRENEKAGGNALFQLEVFYVMPNGIETSLGFSDVANVASGVKVDYDFDLSAVSGTAPATSKLGYKVIWTGGSSGNARVYFGPANGNGGGDVGYITVDEVAGLACGATAPSDLIATAASPTQVDLTWTYDGTNNNYYTIYRDGAQIATNIVTGTYSDTTVAQNTTYAYTVRGYNTTDACESADSNTANVTTPSCTETIPSSIIWNGTTTAAGDFTGLSFVNLTDIGTAEYKVTESGGGAGTITNINQWTNRLDNSNATLSAGTDRLMVVAADYEYGADPGQIVVTATCNGVTFSQLVNANGREYVWIGYLSDADAATCAGNPISVNFAGGGPAQGIWQASFAGVDQTTPLVDSQIAYNAAATSLSFTNLNVEAGGWAMYAFGMNGETHTPATGFTERWDELTAGASWAGADMATPTTTTISGTATANANTRVVLGIASIRPAAGGETIMIDWSTDPLTPAASTVLTNGNPYNIYARGNDTECGTMYYGDPTNPNTTPDGLAQNFTWSSCIETKTLTLTPITDPITGTVSVTATGTAAGIQVGTTPAPTNASGWNYVPTQDDNTTIVSFYATGTGDCGTLTDSQLNVSTDTMAAPIITGFVADDVVDTAAPLEIPISTFTATDNVAVTGYMITESATPPLAGDAGWLGSAPVTYTVPGYGTYTLYSWAKDAAGNVSTTVSSIATITNCTEVGTVSVSISPDPGAGDITGATIVTATPANGASNGMVRWRRDGGAWVGWLASGSTYTPSASIFGTIDFESTADGSCGAASPVYSAILNRIYDSRVDALEPILWTPTQNGLTGIRVLMQYHDDKNSTGSFLVEYKLASEPTTWTTPANMPTADGGAGDADGTRNEEIIVNLSGLTSGETYDVRMTFDDPVDGLIGPGVYTVQVTLVAWVDNAMLHNSNRFPGTVKHSGDWGTTTGYAGGIMCATCHAKNTGNIKRIKGAISFPDGTAMPGGGTSSAVTLMSAEDGTSDFGDDSGAPRTSSNQVCEVCHTFDGTVDPAARINGTNVHAANQGAVSNHYDNADCIKCHEHKGGFKASCDSCHASPPINNLTDLVKDGSTPGDATGSVTVGKHVKHANDLSFACNTCHTGWETTGEMPKGGQINIGFVTPGGNGGTYDGRSTGGGYNPDAGTGTSVTTGDAQTCAVYCHGYGSPQWADAGTAICGACHGQTGSVYGDNRDAAPDGSAGAGGRDLSNALTGFKVGKHANHLDNSIAETGDPCALCHFGTLYPDVTHVDGTVDVQLRQAAVSGDGSTGGAGISAIFTAGGPGACSNMECHGDAQWDSAASGGCTLCHGYPPNSTNNSHAAGVTAVNHDSLNITPNHDDCNYCHGYKDNGSGTLSFVDVASLKGAWTPTATSHQNGQVTMNGDGNATAGDDAGFNATNGGCDAAACHGNDATHRVGGGNTGSTIELVDIGPGSCATCHDTGVGSAPVVTAASSHVKVTAAGTFGDCTNCHSGHYTKAGGVQIPNNATVGINYVQAGHGGIKLGGPGTNALISGQTTEAQICWACHDNDGVSEWGVNTDTNAGGANYNFGSLTQSNWVGASWTSANFSYKTAGIQSTHSVSGNAAGPGMDAVADIRCSYCHDVHDLNSLGSDASSGKPWLRGTWMGNPYREDGAPRSTNTYAGNLNLFGAVPRGGSQHTELGGYQIDQNNGNPTNGWTLSTSAGICTVCHGTDVDNMNEFGTAATDWVGTNGHSNAVIGGTGSNAANIFSSNDRNPGGVTTGRVPGNPSTAYMSSQDRGFGFRSIAGAEGEGWDLSPNLNHADRPYGWNDYDWGATVDAGTTDPLYHKFSCSKCHNPHASRLPRLMITNCLDTNHNSWDTKAGVDPLPTGNALGGYAMGPDNAGVTFSNATSAQNCHRVADPQFGNSTGAGWNNVTPWVESPIP